MQSAGQPGALYFRRQRAVFRGERDFADQLAQRLARHADILDAIEPGDQVAVDFARTRQHLRRLEARDRT
ncbi:MAG: hypothetical protein LBK55_06505 [Azoarcus sp.]|nr:hypothetical protein [Azoarcus sp.]